jgi:zinc transporter 1/2/3
MLIVHYYVLLLSHGLILIMASLYSGLDSSVASNVCVALASGTFIYVAVMEVIMKELAVKTDIHIKLLMILLGFGLMSMLALWV